MVTSLLVAAIKYLLINKIMSTSEKVPQASPEMSPVISSGAGAPGTTPAKIGDMYIDTSGAKVYVACAVSSSADWKILN